MLKKLLIPTLLVLCCVANASAQQTLYVRSSDRTLSANRRIVQLKWATDDVINDRSVDLYRTSGSTRIKINPTPIARVKELPNTKDTILGALLAAAEEPITDANDKDSRDMLVLISAASNNEFARALGMYYEDSSAREGETYTYEVVNAKTSAMIATAEPLRVAAPAVIAAPMTLTARAEDARVALQWSREERFTVWNVFRATSEAGPFARINRLPVFIFQFDDANGKPTAPKDAFVDSLLENGKTYYYQIRGVDEMAQESVPSKSVSATPHDMTPPAALGKLNLKLIGQDAHLSWKPSIAKDAAGYNVFRSPTFRGEFSKITETPLKISDTTYVDKGLAESQSYFYYVEVLDNSGNSNRSATASAFRRDATPPAVPSGLAATATAGKITLTWQPNAEKDLKGYKLYRSVTNKKDYLLLSPKALKQTLYKDSLPKTLKNKFFYRITALDTNYNESAQSKEVEIALPDVTAPVRPTLKRIVADSAGIIFTWTKNTEHDLDHYTLYRKKDSTAKAEEVARSPKDKYTLSIKRPFDGKFYWFVTASDSAGNESSPSNLVIVESSRPSEHQEVTGMTARYDTTKKAVLLNWTGDLGKTLYAIYREEELKDTSLDDNPPAMLLKTVNALEFVDNTAQKESNYRYLLRRISPDGERRDYEFPESIFIR